MNLRLLAPLLLFPLVLPAQGTATHSATSFAVADSAAALTPWDIYLACHGLNPGAAELDGPAVDGVEESRARAFCGLTLPRLGTRFAGVERTQWQNALANPPLAGTWLTLRTRGERLLLQRLDLLGQISIGGQLLRFDFGKEALSDEQVRQVRALAKDFAALLASDTTEFLTVTGYADSDSSGEERNRQQARRRAEAIVDELATAGISRTRVRIATQVVEVRNGAEALRREARAAALHVGTAPGRALANEGVAPAPASSLGVTGLLVGTTDFLIEEAREQIESYLLREGALRICSPQDGWKQMLPATCALVPDTGAVGQFRRGSITGLYFPGMGSLRDAIRDDLRSIPYRVGQDALRAKIVGATGVGRERAVLALYLLHYVEELARAASPAEALVRAAEGLAHNRLAPVRIDTTQVVRAVTRATALVRTVTTAGRDLRATWNADALPDSLALYALRAIAVNTVQSGGGEFPDYVGGFAARLDDALTGLRRAQRLLADIEAGWVTLRNLPQDSMSTALRRARVAQLMGDAVDLAFTGFTENAALDREFLRFATPVHGLAVAVADQDAPAVLSNLLTISRLVDDAGMLRPEQLRVLAFATDVAEAQRSDDVKSAFERLVGDGPGYVGKRSSAERYWRVNAYVGVAGGVESLVDAEDVADPVGGALGFTVPIGVEVGWPAGRRGSHGILVQLVDLGAIASARIGNNADVESFPEFGFGAVVAPGLYYVQSLGSSPLAVIAGAAYFPQARVSENGEEAGGLRATVSLAVDVPLFP